MIQRLYSSLLLATAMGLGLGLTTQARASDPAKAEHGAGAAAQPGEQPGAGKEAPQACPGQAAACSKAQVAGILDVINTSAIDTAKLALSKSQNEDVREYAQKQLDFHTKLEKKLTDLVDAEGITPADSDISMRLKARHQRTLDALGSSPQFDRDYAAHEVLCHATTFGLLHAIAAQHAEETEGAHAEKAEKKHAAGSEGGYAEESEGSESLTALFAKVIEKAEKHERKALELQSKIAGACGGSPEAAPAKPAAPTQPAPAKPR